MSPDEQKKIRSHYLSVAEESVANFVIKNSAVLPQLIEAVLNPLKTGDIGGVSAASYQLFSAAKSFGREDITFVAEMLYKSMKQRKFASEPKVLMVFEKALHALGHSPNANPKLLKSLSDTIYAALRKCNS